MKGIIRRGALVTSVVVGAVLLASCGGPSGSLLSGSATPLTAALAMPRAPTSSAARVRVGLTMSTSTSTSPTCAVLIDLGKWSADRLASQMIVTSADVNSLPDANTSVREGAGAIVLMGNGTSSAVSLQIATLVSQARSGIKPLIMTDEEGGQIQRLSSLVGSMPWPRTMASTMSSSQVFNLAAKVGSNLKNLGVTVDLAPVVDLDAGPGPSRVNPDGKRSFSSDPGIASAYAKAFVTGLQSAGVLAVLKHFPGLGGSSGNTDVMRAHTLPYSSLVRDALIPFKKLAPSVKLVMVSNASVPGLSNHVPSSLSPKVISILRNVVGFKGIVISDSLETVSISSFQPSLGASVVEAAQAGVDMVMLASSDPVQLPMFQSARAALGSAITSGVIKRSVAEGRVGRILELKGVSPSCIYY